MLDGLPRLRHDAVVRGHHQNHDIGRLGAARTHGSKRFVTGGIEEGDHATVGCHMVGANMLGNAAGFASSHFSAANVVQQRGLAVVNVAHHRNDWRARQQLCSLCFHLFLGESFRIVQRCLNGGMSHFFHYDHGRILIQRLVDGHHLAQLHQQLDDF